MSDPAVEAAWAACKAQPTPWTQSDVQDIAVEAAREALAPLREHIEEARTWKPYDTRDIGEAVLYDSFMDLLDQLSRHIYPSEEL